MAKQYREFLFEENSGTTTDYRDAIESALEDEDLAVQLRQGERLVCVLHEEGGYRYDRVVVPLERIVPLADYRRTQAAFATLRGTAK